MIKILGTKRIVVIVALLAINALFAAGVYLYYAPEMLHAERRYRGHRAKISSLQSDIDRLQIEFDQLEAQRAQFEELKEKGFFGSQFRRQAEKVLEKIQQESGVISAVASIDSGTVEENEEAKKAEHKILRSPITIKIQAVDDVDVYRYIYLMENVFPSHVALTNITLTRKGDLSSTVLRGIVGGTNPPLVNADLKFVWRTMIPESEIIDAPGGGT